MTTPEVNSGADPQPIQQTYMASAQDVYGALEQMLQFSAGFDLIHKDDQTRTITFSTPGISGLFIAKVAEGTDPSSSTVQVTVPVGAGEGAQSEIAKFYKDLGDQLMVQGATQTMPPATTTVLNTHEQPTQAMPTTPEAPAASAAPAAGAAAGGNQSDAPTHRAPKNKFAALLTDENAGKTSTMAIAALVVAVVFLIFGFVALGVHPPVVLCIIFAIIAAALCVAAYMKTQPGKEHGRLFTMIAAGATVIALVLSLIGAAGGKRDNEAPTTTSSPTSSAPSSESSDCKSFSWPASGAAAKIPAPKSTRGMDAYEFTASYSVTVCDVTASDFESYVNELRSKGFTESLAKSDDTFSAENTAGDKVMVMHNPKKDTMSISIESKEDADREAQKKAEEEAAKQAEEQRKAEEERKKAEEEQKRLEEQEKKAQEEEAKKQQEAQNQNSGGVTPSVKEAMDSYEAYMNKYCDFMEKYNSSSDKAGMMTDYLKMMQEYSDMTEKIDGLDQSSWTDADLQYYLEVMNRINQRLASVS